MSSYTLLPYGVGNLSLALSGKIGPSSDKSFTTPQEILSKDHFAYLKEYLGKKKGIKAKTIIVEHDYISKDYLVDYASYYASCFDNYEKKCNRIHFFSSSFKKEKFDATIVKPTDKASRIWNSYLGYIIAKPIPLKVIGKTVLRTYPKKGTVSERHYFGNREYEINVFGNKVSIKSLAFMEQDGVVSVCATAAIWMMLQKASNNSYATLKTPSEITDEADIVGTHGERLFPNKGLSVKQISKSIFRSGLVSEIRTGKNAEEVHLINTAYLKRIVNAYAPIGIPIVIVLNVPYKKSDDNFGYGYHAVTITGYKTIPYATSEPKEKIAWRSESITKLFVHDDGWGPFARMDFGEKDNEIINNWSKKFKVAKPSKLTDIIIPVYHKIRISYDDVELIVGAFHRILWRVYKKILKKNINWDIKLNYSEKYKQDSKTFNNSLREHIHLKSMPKYIWIAQCYFGNLLVMDVLFDATDVAIGNFGLSIFFHNAEIRANLSLILDKYPNFANYFAHPSKLQFYEFFKSECKNKNFDK